jgi:hypothetical protein
LSLLKVLLCLFLQFFPSLASQHAISPFSRVAFPASDAASDMASPASAAQVMAAGQAVSIGTTVVVADALSSACGQARAAIQGTVSLVYLVKCSDSVVSHMVHAYSA